MTAGDRHSSNTNDRGSAEARRARKNWLLDVWGADVDVVTWDEWVDLHEAIFDETPWLKEMGQEAQTLFVVDNHLPEGHVAVIKGLGRPTCRCFRCGKLVTYETMEVDRIVPHAEKTKRYPNGGTYVRENIRPVCPDCNKKLEGEARRKRNAKRKKRNEQARARHRRARAETYESHA